jgi:hypothetical protein
MTTSSLLLRIAVFVPAAVIGCAGDKPSSPGGGGGDGGGIMQVRETANSQACQLLKAGPFTPVTGPPTYQFSNPGPAVSNDKKAYRVSLSPPSRTGHFSFKTPAAGEYVIFTSRAVPIAVFTWDGVIVDVKSTASSVPECSEVKNRESFALVTDSKPHVIRVGPDSGGAVDLVITSATP